MSKKLESFTGSNAPTCSASSLRGWDRLHWAVEMRSKSCKPNGMLIGTAWHQIVPPTYKGEPTRPLLFRTRKVAREWCAAKAIECARHSPDWKFKPVRVRETILPQNANMEAPNA